MTRFIFRLSLILCAVLLILTVASRAIGGADRTPPLSYIAHGVVLFDLAHGLALPLSIPTERQTQTTWSRDGKLAFRGVTGNAADVFVFDPAIGSTFNISETLMLDNGEPDWSPDGTRIAFMSGFGDSGRIYIWDSSDNRLTLVSRPDEFIQGSPLWSPDGQYLVYVVAEVGTFNFTFNIIEVTGGALIASSDFVFLNAPVAHYSWSADSSTLAFTSGQYENFEISLLDISSGAVTTMIEHPARDYSPLFSPDGRYLAFLSDRDNAYQAVYVLDLEFNEVVNISNALRAANNTLAWSFDSQHIAFVSDRTGTGEIYVYTLATGRLFQIPPDNRRDFDPQWLP